MTTLDALQKEVGSYDFFALLRQLHRATYEHEPRIQYRGSVSYRFPVGAVDAVEPPIAEAATWQVFTNFMGIANPGTRGSLPTWYSGLIHAERTRPAPPGGDEPQRLPLRDFVDLLNHPFIALYARAFLEHDLPLQVELDVDAKVQRVLRSLVGFGTNGLLERLRLNPQFLLAHAAVLARRPATAAGMQLVLQLHFGVPFVVEPFAVAIRDLDPADRLSLAADSRLGLGLETVLGDKARLTQGKFRLRIGPLDWAVFATFLPGGKRMLDLQQIVRTMVGIEFDYDVRLVLAAAEFEDRQPEPGSTARAEPGPARLRFGGENAQPARLGWSTWLGERYDERDADDTIIQASDLEMQPGSGSPQP